MRSPLATRKRILRLRFAQEKLLIFKDRIFRA